LLRALNTPRRREILRLVWDQELCAGEIHRAFGDVTFGAVSQHLRVLEEARLVERRSAGRHRYYRARKGELGALGEWLESMWDSALDRLALLSELEAARRGPRARRRRSALRQANTNRKKTKGKR
jgi:DNA-binding transcriptional ArsR family regulator